MNRPEVLPPGNEIDPGKEIESGGTPARGPSILLLFGLVALALAAAIGLALLIVAPFYRRR
jgi:hypothetical protein